MIEYLKDNLPQIADGLLFGLGILAVYLGAIFSGALIRSLSGAGSSGITFIGRFARGWWDYLRGDDRNIINVTLNMVVDNQLKFDTLVADRRLWFVWPNAYRVMLIRRAAKLTTADNPVLIFPQQPAPKSRGGRAVHWCTEKLYGRLASVKIIENGKTSRVPLIREDDYKAGARAMLSVPKTHS
jgi:hypothetical protein